jgi:SAM-dependent methyltransferase
MKSGRFIRESGGKDLSELGLGRRLEQDNRGAALRDGTSGDMAERKRGNDFVIAEKAALPEVDGIISNNVIEHFFDPVQQFREFHALLKPGALMAHSTACYDYLYPFSRFHTVFLLGKSPEVLAQRSGFEIVSRERDGGIYQRRVSTDLIFTNRVP